MSLYRVIRRSDRRSGDLLPHTLRAAVLVFCAAAIVGVPVWALFVNGDFEIGAPGSPPPPPWIVNSYLNTGFIMQTPQTFSGLNLMPGGSGLTFLRQSPAPAPDPDLGAAATLRWPRYGYQAAIVNVGSSGTTGHGRNVNALVQTMTLTPGDIDPLDGQLHIRFVFAPVLQNPAHIFSQQPYYFIQVRDVSQNKVLYNAMGFSGQAGVPWQTVNAGGSEIDYTEWQLFDLPLDPAVVPVGDAIELTILAAGCSPGAHFGKVWVDGVGSTIPGISLEGTAPATALAGSNLTYDLMMRNGGFAPSTGVVVSFSTPPNTTYQSITPPFGFTCSTPPAGVAGTVTCSSGGLQAGSFRQLSVTVNINPGTVGTIREQTYSIKSTQETTLLGPPIDTVLTTATPPLIITDPSDRTVRDGDLVTFTAAATGAPAPSVQWEVSTDHGATFTPIYSANSPAYSFNATAAMNGNEYRAVFTNIAASSPTNPATLTVLYPAQVTAIAGDGQSAMAGQPFPIPLQVKVVDQFSNPCPGAQVLFTVIAGASGASGFFAAIPPQPIVTGANGIATAPVLTANNIGGQFTVAANVAGLPSAAFALIVIAPPVFSKTLAPSINLGDSMPVTFTIKNENVAALMGLTFNDVFPAGLQIDKLSSNACGGAVNIDAAAGAVTFTGGTVGPSSSCAITVDVIGVAPGPQTNPPVTLKSNEAPPSVSAEVTVYVDPSWWMWFFHAT